MNTKLRAEIETAIDAVIQKHAEDNLWTGFIHDDLHVQMAIAAEQVFDATMAVQKLVEENT